MGLQQQFNNEAISYLPKIKKIIKNADDHDSDNITFLVVHEINHSSTPIAQMSKQELHLFQERTLSVLKFKGYLK